jgi:N-acetylglutamate synthase-like GNAT family acetyltransferase
VNGEPIVREAQPDDTARVKDFCREIDPKDYLLQAWDHWTAAPGVSVVVENEGRVVGCLHASVVEAGQAFVQGLRVDPAHRRQGLGLALMRHLAVNLAARRVRIQRAVTARENHPARALVSELGWQEVRVVTRRQHRSAAIGYALQRRWEEDRASASLAREATLISEPGLAFFHRIYRSATRSWTRQAASDGRIVGEPDAGFLIDPPRGQSLWVHTSLGEAAWAPEVLGAWLAPSTSGPRGELTLEAPEDPALQRALDRLGFEPAGSEHRYVVVEQRVTGAPALIAGQR